MSYTPPPGDSLEFAFPSGPATPATLPMEFAFGGVPGTAHIPGGGVLGAFDDTFDALAFDVDAPAVLDQRLPNFIQDAQVHVITGPVTITGAQVLAPFTQAATATVADAPTIHINAAQVLDAFLQAAAIGYGTVSFTADQQLPNFTQTATLGALAGLTGAQVLPDFVQVAALSAPASFSAAQVLEAFTQDASLDALASFSAAQVLPPFAQHARMAGAYKFVCNARTWEVGPQNRLYAVAAQNRLYAVQPQSRIWSIDAQSRTWAVYGQVRVLTIPAQDRGWEPEDQDCSHAMA